MEKDNPTPSPIHNEKVVHSPESHNPLSASFHLSIGAAWLAIGVLWIITPLSWLFLLWNFVTIAPQLAGGRPASHGGLGVIRWIVLGYTCLEVPFSIYYRYLAYRAQARRDPPHYTRQFLRTLLKKGLENGLDPDPSANDTDLQLNRDLEQFSHDRPPSQQTTQSTGQSTPAQTPGRPEVEAKSFAAGLRKRGWLGGEGPATPDANAQAEEPTYPPGTAAGDLSQSSAGDDTVAPSPLLYDKAESSGAESDTTAASKGSSAALPAAQRRASYAPSFLPTKLAFTDPRALDFRNYIRVWFTTSKGRNPRFEQIYRQDMADWIGWSLYGVPLEELEAEREEWIRKGRPEQHIDGVPDLDEEGLEIEKDKLGLVEHCVELVEHRAATKFKPGRNPKIKVIRLTLDPVRVCSRPLILYVFVWLVTKAVTGNAKRHGFKEVKDGDIRYLVRIPEGWQPEPNLAEAEQPLLMVHGLGMGLAQYATLLNYFSTHEMFKKRPVMVLIQPSISMAFFSKGYLEPPDMHSSTAAIRRAAKRHGFDKSGLTVLSHSNGTIVHGWLIKEAPELCRRNCLVDPVTFCLWEPWVCFQFLYAKASTPIEYLMRYFVGRELGVANLLQRHFNWSANLLFPEDIPNHTDPYKAAFFLAGRDAILSPHRIRKYLLQHGVKEAPDGRGVGRGWGGMKFHAGKKHGESMIGEGCAFDQIMAWVGREEGEGVDGREWEL